MRRKRKGRTKARRKKGKMGLRKVRKGFTHRPKKKKKNELRKYLQLSAYISKHFKDL